jgi:hypothetical protein
MTWHAASVGKEAIRTHGHQKDKKAQTYSIPLSFLRGLRLLYWSVQLRVLPVELSNLLCRIRWRLEIYESEIGGCTGPTPSLMGERPRSECQTCRRAYISCMQRVLDSHPSLTIVDSYLMSRVWWDGWGSAHRKDRQQNQQSLCSLCSPMGSHSMPHQAVQQSTKHGQSTPLPLRA